MGRWFIFSLKTKDTSLKLSVWREALGDGRSGCSVRLGGLITSLSLSEERNESERDSGQVRVRLDATIGLVFVTKLRSASENDRRELLYMYICFYMSLFL